MIHEGGRRDDAAPPEISGKEFRFVVKRGGLYLQENGTLGREPYEFGLLEGESRQFEHVPAGEYTVTEQDASVEGYVWEADGAQENADGTYSRQLTISDSESAGEASFDNRYTKIENGSLTVRKTVAGGPEEAADRAYQVEITTVRRGVTMWLDAGGNLTQEKTVLTVGAYAPLSFDSVPAGTYTVTENTEDAAFKDYSLSVTYSAESSFTIEKDERAEVEITNTYTYLYTPVRITKTVTGNMGNRDLSFGFDVYVKDADGQPVAVEGITDVHGLLRFNIMHGQERLIEKLPKGAVLTIVEHNEHYETSVNGSIVGWTSGDGGAACGSGIELGFGSGYDGNLYLRDPGHGRDG